MLSTKLHKIKLNKLKLLFAILLFISPFLLLNQRIDVSNFLINKRVEEVDKEPEPENSPTVSSPPTATLFPTEPAITGEIISQEGWIGIQLPDVNLDQGKLMELINKKRVESGVNPFRSNDSEVCEVAQSALDLLVRLGRMPTVEETKEVKGANAIRKFNVAQGYGFQNEVQAVEAFYNHRDTKWLFTAGEFVWGCTKTQYSYAVLVATF